MHRHFCSIKNILWSHLLHFPHLLSPQHFFLTVPLLSEWPSANQQGEQYEKPNKQSSASKTRLSKEVRAQELKSSAGLVLKCWAFPALGSSGRKQGLLLHMRVLTLYMNCQLKGGMVLISVSEPRCTTYMRAALEHSEVAQSRGHLCIKYLGAHLPQIVLMGGVPTLPSPFLREVASAWMKHQITHQHFSVVLDSQVNSTATIYCLGSGGRGYPENHAPVIP